MYASHKKNINRHKSFHPLTFRNLSKVEQKKELEEQNKKANAERELQLQHDQEQRRYDDLILAASADSVSGQLAKFRQVENIFAAELNKNNNNNNNISSSTKVGSSSNNSMSFHTPSILKSSTLTFKKEEDDVEESKFISEENINSTQLRKRGRDENNNNNNFSTAKSSSSSENIAETNKDKKGIVTGFLSTSDAAQLRKEFDTLQKQRHDPLRRIEKFQNKMVAAEAKRRALEKSSISSESTTTPVDKEKDVIRSRIQELLEMKKRK